MYVAERDNLGQSSGFPDASAEVEHYLKLANLLITPHPKLFLPRPPPLAASLDPIHTTTALTCNQEASSLTPSEGLAARVAT